MMKNFLTVGLTFFTLLILLNCGGTDSGNPESSTIQDDVATPSSADPKDCETPATTEASPSPSPSPSLAPVVVLFE